MMLNERRQNTAINVRIQTFLASVRFAWPFNFREDGNFHEASTGKPDKTLRLHHSCTAGRVVHDRSENKQLYAPAPPGKRCQVSTFCGV
jgi:hypothetical protein